MKEKEPKIILEKSAQAKEKNKELTQEAQRLLRKKEKVGADGLTEEEQEKVNEILAYLSSPEAGEEKEVQPEELPAEEQKNPWYKRAWGKWLAFNQQLDRGTDQFMKTFNYDLPRDSLLDKITRKRFLKKIKERGFESFEDFRLHDISINTIKKKPYGKQLDTFAKGLDRTYFDFYGKEQKERADIEEIRGQIIIESPLFGAKPIPMEWKAYVYQTKEEAEAREYSIDLYWHENLNFVASASWADLDIPNIVQQQGKKMGMDVMVPAHASEYNVYYKPHREGQAPADRIPINKETMLYKLYYIKLTRQVFEQLKKYVKQSCFTDQAINPKYVDTEFEVSTEISKEIDQEKEQEIINGLQQRQFDEKIFYYGEGADKFLEIVKSQEYKLSNVELKLIKDNLEKLAPLLKGKTIYDLGAANALKVVPMLEKQLEESDSVDYVPIDINPAMTFAAAANINNPRVSIEGQILDFTKPLEGKLKDEPKIMALLGSTLGNGDHDFQQKLLKNISKAMTKDDALLVGVQLKTDLNKILQMYENPPGKDFIMTTVKNLGFPENKIELEMQADEEHSQIKVVIKIKENLVVNRSGHEIPFDQGENLTIFVSQKYDVDELEKTAAKAGLDLEESFVDNKKQFQLAVFKKKE